MNYLKDPRPKDPICMPPWDIPSRSKLISTDDIPSKYQITGTWRHNERNEDNIIFVLTMDLLF